MRGYVEAVRTRERPVGRGHASIGTFLTSSREVRRTCPVGFRYKKCLWCREAVEGEERMTALLYLTARLQRVMETCRFALMVVARAKSLRHINLRTDRHAARTRVLSLQRQLARTAQGHE